MEDIILSPSDFVALVNQTLEFAYPQVVIEGELSDFRISKNRWLYFNLKDEESSVAFFGTVYQLPGPLEDGLRVRVTGLPRLHARYGFSVNISAMQPVGEGSIKKVADLLRAKLEAEGLFSPERKRVLPSVPERLALVTAVNSAAAADFIKIVNERWRGLEIFLVDALVQGDQAPIQLVQAIDSVNKMAELPDVLVITRGGGSLDDLAAFNDERVVRAVAASRVPTLVAIGHEVDVSLAELAADVRASTPTNAGGLVVPDKTQLIKEIQSVGRQLGQTIEAMIANYQKQNRDNQQILNSRLKSILVEAKADFKGLKKLVKLLDPQLALKRGYAIITHGTMNISRVSQVKPNEQIGIELIDGKIRATVQQVKRA